MMSGDPALNWVHHKKDIIFSKNQLLNEFIFASEFLQDAKDMRMLEETGQIPNHRNMDLLMRKDPPSLKEPNTGKNFE